MTPDDPRFKEWGSAGRAANLARQEREHAERREDVLWMCETGESLSGAAARLGLKVSTLEKWCERTGLTDALAKLRAREPFDPIMTRSERAKLAVYSRLRAS